MFRRICLWAIAGFVLACFRVIYSFATMPNPNLARWPVVAMTAPASLVGRSMPLAYYWFILLNAAMYALVGVAIEPLWRRHASSSSD
jgi:hypothetical protein